MVRYTTSPIHIIYISKKNPTTCKYFSQAQLLRNHLFINALQNLLFCIPKVAVLHGKSVGFTLQNSRFRNAKTKLSIFDVIIFTKPRLFFIYTFQQKQGNYSTNKRLQIQSNNGQKLEVSSTFPIVSEPQMSYSE